MNTSSREVERRQLAEWLAERALDQKLVDESPLIMSQARLRYDEPVVSPSPGDIYLLRPASSLWGPVYVLVVDSDGATWRVIPFSRYATPAVPGEWLSGIDSVPLRVLCGWNARNVAAAVFLPGVVRKLGAAQGVEVQQLDQYVRGVGEVAEDKAGRFGPPIIHPADPRYEYLDEERARVDDHLPMVGEGRDGDANRSRWLLAAEGRPRYGGDDPS